MPVTITTLPARSDNYFFLLHDEESGRTALVDAPETAPIRAALEERGWGLDEILITHHHGDHIEAVDDLRAAYGARVTGAAQDAHRLPPLDRAVSPGESFDLFGEKVEVMDAPGHTVGHIAFHMPGLRALFSADSLMALGCGRLFEGSPEQMWQTLQRLAALPEETIVYSGHEYTAANAAFALTIEPENPDLISREQRTREARAAGRATVPSALSEELATNPFLRAGVPQIKASLGMPDASDVEAFAEIRRRKDRF
ncbi:hydroxyacylglutathione hydrolase [Pseudoroseicyclus tamaricis]|uniref:Hydroxyacylglutathione hydrolase n=1 Tax=Pseudoroseicyclus tamaricis TaxID=2705421 RepID=A0A6B2JFR5_9RHOB|nr:hydroxyacylglutathione hydrolase [Pseudoroseicyclus tamaricis]NDU99920.1 hydroxyacylglutathione hydrolase [Pseudoroseicyclus tamaricis]